MVRVKRITIKVINKIKFLCGKSLPSYKYSGIESAAANDTTPRIPAHVIYVNKWPYHAVLPYRKLSAYKKFTDVGYTLFYFKFVFYILHLRFLFRFSIYQSNLLLCYLSIFHRHLPKDLSCYFSWKR